jgi:dynein heavy chain
MVFDADPDPSWIESMNTAMDDNQTLTLASHERIFLQSSSRIIVEAQDMKHATPATVSRAGIIYMQYSDSQWRSLVASWVVSHSSVSDAQRHELHRLFEAYVPPILGFMELRRASLYSWSPLAGVSSLLRSLDAFGSDAAVEEVFSFCCIWSFGSILGVSLDGVDYRPIFSDWWRVELSSIVRLPLDGSIFDYVLGRDGIEFEPWMDHPDFSQRVSFDSDSSSPFEVIVPTADLAPASFWANKHVSLGHSVMIGGETGVGKTQLALSILRKTAVVGFPEEQAASRSKTLVRMVNLHPVSDANSIRNVLNEPESSNLLLFVDDFNLPVPDDYGCRGAHEAIRQQLNFGYWHEPRSLEQHTLTGCQYIVAFDSSPRTAPLNSRLQRHFLPVWMCRPSPSSLLTILDTFLAGHFSTSSGFSKTFSGVLKDVMKGVLDVHQACLDKFSMSPTNIHCAFNMRHMLGVVDGLLRAAPEDFSTPDGLVHLWMHESERVYADGLSSPADFDFFCDTMAAQTKRSFPQFGLSRFYAGDPPNKLIFHTSSEGRYIAVENSDELQPDIELHLAQLNHNPGPMGCLDVTLFPDACLSIIRIARILRQSAGHVMTIGLAGSGKRTLCRLAAAIADVPLTSCSAHDLGVDLARAHKAAGLSGLGRAFLLHHSQVSVT